MATGWRRRAPRPSTRSWAAPHWAILAGIPGVTRNSPGIASRCLLLRQVRSRVAEAGFRPTSLDLTIIGLAHDWAHSSESSERSWRSLSSSTQLRSVSRRRPATSRATEGAGRTISASAPWAVLGPRVTLTFSTRSRRTTRPFELLDPANVLMYTCGPTVYGPRTSATFGASSCSST